MNKVRDKPASPYPRSVRIHGQTLSLSSPSDSTDRRRDNDDSLLDSLLDPHQGYLFRHHRRKTSGAQGDPRS